MGRSRNIARIRNMEELYQIKEDKDQFKKILLTGLKALALYESTHFFKRPRNTEMNN